MRTYAFNKCPNISLLSSRVVYWNETHICLEGKGEKT